MGWVVPVGAAGGRTSDNPTLLKLTLMMNRLPFVSRVIHIPRHSCVRGAGRQMKNILLTGGICYTDVLDSMRLLCEPPKNLTVSEV